MRKISLLVFAFSVLAMTSSAYANSFSQKVPAVLHGAPVAIHQAAGSLNSTLSTRAEAMPTGVTWSFKHVISFSQGNPFCRTPSSDSPSSVPESNTFALVAMGLLGISCMGYRKLSPLA